jgi:hypothetical protein
MIIHGCPARTMSGSAAERVTLCVPTRIRVGECNRRNLGSARTQAWRAATGLDSAAERIETLVSSRS